MKKNIFFSSLIFIFISFFYLKTKTLTSGYHFYDDHDIIRINHELTQHSFFKVLYHWFSNDFQLRFRPLYFIHRVIETYFFGDNLFIWSLYVALLFYITLFTTILSLKKLNFSNNLSLFFLLLTYLGPQMKIWWEIGNNETLGMFLLSFCFYHLKTTDEKHFKRNLLKFNLFLIFASLSKESFVLIIPSFCFLKTSIDKKSFSISWKEAILKNISLIIPLFIMIIELLIIIFLIGTNKVGYAGIERTNFTTFISRNYHVIYSILTETLVGLSLVVCAFLVVFYFIKKQSTKLRNLYDPLIFSLLLIGPNIYLYSKSGMYDRYFLPTTFGAAFLIVSLMAILDLYKEIIFFIIYTLIFFVSNIYQKTLNAALLYTEKAHEISEIFEALSKYTTPNSKIFLISDRKIYYESSFSLPTYAEIELNRKIIHLDSFQKNMVVNSDVFIYFDKNDLEKEENSPLGYKNILNNSNPYRFLVKDKMPR